MASVTALQLVNRVRLLRRQETTVDFRSAEDQVTLNAVNTAINDTLNSKDWEFDLRHDGQLQTRGKLDLTSSFSTEGTFTMSATLSGLTSEDVFGDYVVRAVAGSAAQPDSAFRIERAGTPAGATSSCFVSNLFRESFVSIGDAYLYYTEYMLPDTVKSVVRATYQENDIALEQISPTVRYEELYPTPHNYFGPPEVVAVGGFDIPTYDNSGSAPDPMLRVAVWPVPDEVYTINYSYYYEHPELVETTDTLVGVPKHIVDDIVLSAMSIVKMAWDSDYAAAHFLDVSNDRTDKKHATNGGSDARRHRIDGYGQRRRGIDAGFPGKVIG